MLPCWVGEAAAVKANSVQEIPQQNMQKTVRKTSSLWSQAGKCRVDDKAPTSDSFANYYYYFSKAIVIFLVLKLPTVLTI